MTLIELAITTYKATAAEQQERAAENAVTARQEFLSMATGCAQDVLGADAAQLDWRYTAEEALPPEVEEATALLEPGRPEYLRYRVDYTDDGGSAFDLVRPCGTCGHAQIDPVAALADLGRLLSAPGSTR
ncbi:hypothetical protein ACWDO7_23025 [Streptomyces sp. NPDC003656]|uniref:hypothetical protein n=1 Tax=Streptomyces sp. NPDC091385 TaxID=3365997 RepID=UPI0038287273